MRRRGFALLTVLWVMVAASVVSLAGTLVARAAVGTARNRMDATRAAWFANDCIQRAHAVIDTSLAEAQARGAVVATWRLLDRATAPLPRANECDVRLEAVGTRLDVNTADAAMLASLFGRIGVADPPAMATRVIEWRNSFGPVADPGAFAVIDGWPPPELVDSLLGAEPARLSINHAPITVLSAVPGFTDELLARVALERDAGRAVSDIRALAASVSAATAEALLVHAPDVERLTTTLPEAWLLRATGFAGTPPATATIDARVVLDRAGVAITRWVIRQ